MNTRTKECPECAGLMTSRWSDGKTRVHAMECERCGHRRDVHRNETSYLENRHADPLAEIDTEIDYDDFVTRAERLKRDATDRAFSDVLDYRNSATRIVQIRHTHDGDYTVAAYADHPDEGDGAGPDRDLPYGAPDVSWSAPAVYINSDPFEMVDVNDGSAWVYLRHVTDVDVEIDPPAIRIDC